MAIKRIRVENFKSFEALDLNLGAFNVFVGANAAGKSNLLQLFKFIADMTRLNLDNAIAIQGGPKFLRNIGLPADRKFVLDVTADSNASIYFPATHTTPKKSRAKKQPSNALSLWNSLRPRQIKESHRRLVLGPGKGEGESFEIIEDSCTGFFGSTAEGGSLTIANEHGKLKLTASFPEQVKLDPIFEELISKRNEADAPRLISFSANPYLFMPFPSTTAQEELAISYYDFDPRFSKQAVRITGRSDLDESGENLAIALQGVLADKEKRKLLSAHISDLLPFVSNLNLDFYTDKSVLMTLAENYHSGVLFPASFVSDGTVGIIAILIALFFEKNRVVALEEPERNIHPQLVSRLLSVIRQASTQKQILLSTHSPALVSAAGLENLFLVSRSKKGFSIVTKPADSEMVNSFINNEVGIGSLFESNLLHL